MNQIREVEPQKLIWYEPNVIFNFGADSSHPPTGDPAAGFSFHVYCLAADGGFSLFGDRACPEVDEIVFENADRQAEQTGDALLLSEFGATNDLELIRRNVEQAEAHMVSWQYWHYCECDDPTTSGTGVQGVILDPSQPPEGGTSARTSSTCSRAPIPRPWPAPRSPTTSTKRRDASTSR